MHSETITFRQIKAARALLDWSQEDLARAAALSIATIRKLELGFVSPRVSTTSVLREALENAGVGFLESEGVCRKNEEVRTFEGLKGCLQFSDEVVATAMAHQAELFLAVPSAAVLEQLFHAPRAQGANLLSSVPRSKILLTDTLDLPVSSERVEYRSISANYVDPMPFCVFADRHALIATTGESISKIILVRSKTASLSSKRHFLSMWDKAVCSSAYRQEARRQRA